MKTVKTNFRQSVNALNLGGLTPSYYKSITGGLTDVQMDFGIVNDLDTQGYYVLKFGLLDIPTFLRPYLKKVLHKNSQKALFFFSSPSRFISF